MRRDDPFSGGVARRLLEIDRELAAAVRDAQCRDWVADRPDRVGFARLGQARHEIYTAARRYRAVRIRAESLVVVILGAVVAGAGLALGLSLWTNLPLVLAGTVVGGVWAGLAARAGWRWWLRRTSRAGAAPIDDPYLYAGLRRRIEVCAMAARSDRNYRRRPAAADLEYALDWLAAAQDELPGRA
ncbi:hypothetical protein AB0M02_05960 [Actinoplanes sp. NPDC051861]|uniref:hypothetical protein n=1 Tax=Actinoplanes sp. NPDC051861 TaxID=3155170 RepID=UPI0034150AF1